jgi:hypothetical protein
LALGAYFFLACDLHLVRFFFGCFLHALSAAESFWAFVSDLGACFVAGLDTAGAGLPRPLNVALVGAPSSEGALGGP